MKKQTLAEVDKGRAGMPGSSYTDEIARVYLLRPGRYELYVRHAWGSNQGYFEEHGRRQRSYRADSLDALLRIAATEIPHDRDLDDNGILLAAAREAIFEAEDAEVSS